MKKIIITASILFSTYFSNAQWYAEPFYNGIYYPSYESLIDQPDSVLTHIGIYAYHNVSSYGEETWVPLSFIMFDCDTAEYKRDVLKYLKLEKNENPWYKSEYAYHLVFYGTLLDVKKYSQMTDMEKEEFEYPTIYFH